MKKVWLKKTDLWMIFYFTAGTIVHHVYERFILAGEQLPPIFVHVAMNIVSITIFGFMIAMYRVFMQKKSERVTTQTSAISTPRDFFMISELPTWAQNAIRENRNKDGSISNFSGGKDRLSIIGGFSVTFNGKKVYDNMVEITPETTIDFKDLPTEVQKDIRDAEVGESLSIKKSGGQLLISDGQVYFDKKRVININ